MGSEKLAKLGSDENFHKIVTIDGGQRLKQYIGNQATMIVYDENAGHALKTPKVKIDTKKWIEKYFYSYQ